MSFLIERARLFIGKGNKKALATTLEHEGESGWQGSESFKYKEWYSPDGKRGIVVTVCGGPEYGGTYMKDIHLFAMSNLSMGKTEMMRVQAVTEPNEPETRYNVYLDAIQENKDVWMLTGVAYSSSNEGRVSPPHSWSHPLKNTEHEHLTDEEFRQQFIAEMTQEGIYHESEILPEIDIEATVLSFMDQIKRLDFSKPILVPKQATIEESQTSLIGS